MIEACGLTRTFGKFVAVDSIDFMIPAGQVVGFLGPNGAGKTTTIRMIPGFLPPTRGTVRVGGMDVTSHPLAVRSRIGYLPESAPLYTEMRVREYLRFRARLFGIPASRRASAIDLAVRRCRLEEVRGRPIHQLSKGYRQRVGLAAALLHEPPVLILDEPTVGLDPTQIREVRSLIRELAGQHTILLSTHILPEVEVTCDRLMMMARGRIWAQGTVEELRGAALHETRILVETSAPNAEAILMKTPGVQGVETQPLEGAWKRCVVRSGMNAASVRESVFHALVQAGASVRELRIEAPSLEQLFVRVLEKAEMEYSQRNAMRGAAA